MLTGWLGQLALVRVTCRYRRRSGTDWKGKGCSEARTALQIWKEREGRSGQKEEHLARVQWWEGAWCFEGLHHNPV